MKFEDIVVGKKAYIKWHEVEIAGKYTREDVNGNTIPEIYIGYVNQPSFPPEVVGDGNLSEHPLHCWKCKKDLIDNVRLNICTKCNRAICSDSRCAKCHCGTEWDPNLNRRVEKK